MISNCPGAKLFRQPEPEILRCPYCQEELEIWTDEIKTKCSKCKKTITREQAQSCLDWCKYAKECVGEDVYNKYMSNKAKSKKMTK